SSGPWTSWPSARSSTPGSSCRPTCASTPSPSTASSPRSSTRSSGPPDGPAGRAGEPAAEELPPMIESLSAEAARRDRAALTALLQDAVDDGASVGFLPPLGARQGGRHWDRGGAAGARRRRPPLV